MPFSWDKYLYGGGADTPSTPSLDPSSAFSWDKYLYSGIDTSPDVLESPESEWEDIGIFEKHKTTGELRLKGKEGQLGGLGGGALEYLEGKAELPFGSTISDQEIKDLGKSDSTLSGLWGAAKIGAAGAGELVPDIASTVIDFIKPQAEFAAGLVGGEDFKQDVGAWYDSVLSKTRAVDTAIDEGRAQFMRPGTETPTNMSELVHDVSKMWNEGNFQLGEVATDIPYAITEQLADMGTTALIGAATGGGAIAAKAGKMAKILGGYLGLGYAARAAGDTYDDLRIDNVNRLEALTLAGTNAVVQGYLERAGFIKSFGGENFAKSVIQKYNTKLLGRFLLATAAGANAEGWTEGLQNLTDYLVRAAPEIGSIFDKSPQEFIDFLKGGAKTVVEGYIGGSVVGGVLGGSGGAHNVGKDNPNQPAPVAPPTQPEPISGMPQMPITLPPDPLNQATQPTIAPRPQSPVVAPPIASQGQSIADLPLQPTVPVPDLGTTVPEMGTVEEAIDPLLPFGVSEQDASSVVDEAKIGAIGDVVAEVRGRTETPTIQGYMEELDKIALIPDPPARNRALKALSTKIEETLTLIQESKQHIAPEQMQSLYQTLEALSKFNKARKAWADNVRQNILDKMQENISKPLIASEANAVVEPQVTAEAVPETPSVSPIVPENSEISSTTVEVVELALEQSVQKVGNEVYEQVMTVYEAVKPIIDALTEPQLVPITAEMSEQDVAAAQAENQEILSMHEEAKAMLPSVLPEIQERFRTGEWKWLKLSEKEIQNLSSVDWQYLAEKKNATARHKASKQAEIISASVRDHAGMPRIGGFQGSLTTEEIMAAFPEVKEINPLSTLESVIESTQTTVLSEARRRNAREIGAMSRSFGVTEFAPTSDFVRNVVSTQGPQGVIPAFMGELARRGFSQEVVMSDAVARPLMSLARTAMDVQNRGTAVTEDYIRAYSDILATSEALMQAQPEVARSAMSAINKVETEAAMAKKMPRDLAMKKFTDTALQMDRGQTDNIAVANAAVNHFLTDGKRGLNALLYLSAIDSTGERAVAMSEGYDSIVDYIYTAVTGRRDGDGGPAISRQAKMDVARSVSAAINNVFGPHYIYKTVAIGDGPGVAAATVAMVDAFAERWARKNGGQKADFYSDLLDRVATFNAEGKSPDVYGFFIGKGINKTSQVTLGLKNAWGARAMTILASRQITGITVLHEILHAMHASGMLKEMLDSDGIAAVEELLGKSIDSLDRNSMERLVHAFETFLATRAAPTAKMAEVFHEMKRWLSDMLQRIMNMMPQIVEDMAKNNFGYWPYDPKVVTRNVAKAFYSLMNVEGLSDEQLDALTPANYNLISLDMAITERYGASTLPAFSATSEEIDAIVQSARREPIVLYKINNDPEDHTGTVQGADLKDQVAKAKREAETSPIATFDIVEDKKPDTGVPKKGKRPSKVRIDKSSKEEAEALLTKIETAEDKGELDDIAGEVVDDFYRAVIKTPTEVDSKRPLTLGNFKEVIVEKATNWGRMMTTSWFSKTARFQRVMDVWGLVQLGEHVGNLAGLANLAARVTTVAPQVFNPKTFEPQPIPGSESLTQIVDDFGVDARALVEEMKAKGKAEWATPEQLFRQLIVYISATRQMEVFREATERIEKYKALKKEWEDGGKVGDPPHPPKRVLLSEAHQKLAETTIGILRMMYGDKIAIFDAYSDRISKWGHAAILGKLLHYGRISKAAYDRMIFRGSRWIPFQRLVDEIGEEEFPETMPDGSLIEPLKYLTMDISGGLLNPISELIRRAVSVEMSMQRQRLKNGIAEYLMSTEEPHKNHEGMHVLVKRIPVKKNIWEQLPENRREVKDNKHYMLSPLGPDEVFKWKRNRPDYKGEIFAGWRDGEPTYIGITDPELAIAFMKMNTPQAEWIRRFTKYIATPTRHLVGRPLTTAMTFLYNAPIRDMFVGWARSSHGMLPIIDFAIGLVQSAGVMSPTLRTEFPTFFKVANDYVAGLAGMSTLQSQMHEVLQTDLMEVFKSSLSRKDTSHMTKTKRVLYGLKTDLKNRAYERGVNLALLKHPSRYWKDIVPSAYNFLLFFPEMLAEALELSYRLGERRLSMAEEIKDERLRPFYTGKERADGKIVAGYRGILHRGRWKIEKARMAQDPTYVPPESALPIVYSQSARDQATRQVTLDFGSRGASRGFVNGELASKLWVFWNPKMQDFYSTMKLLRPVFDPSAPDHLRRKGVAFLTKMAIGTTLPALAQLAYYWDDDDWWKESYLERVAYIHLWKDSKGKFFRIPAGISFGTLLFRDLVMSTVMDWKGKDPQGVQKWLNRLFDQAPFGLPGRVAMAGGQGGAEFAAKQAAYDLTPTLLQGPMGVALNYDGFFGEPITKPQMYTEELKTERNADRYGYFQNKLARWMNVEPAMAGYIIHRTLPGYMGQFVDAANRLVGKTELAGPEMAQAGTAVTYSGRLDPWNTRIAWGPTSEWVQDFSRLYKTNAAARNSYDNYMEAGNYKRAEEILRDYPLIKDHIWEELTNARDLISDLYSQRRQIISDNQGLTQSEMQLLLITETDQPMSLIAMQQMRNVVYYLEDGQ